MFFKITMMFLKVDLLKSFSNNNAIPYLGSYQKGCFMNHSQWLHFLSVKEDYVTQWSRISNWLRLTRRLIRGLFKMFNDWYGLGTGRQREETRPLYWRNMRVTWQQVIWFWRNVCDHLQKQSTTIFFLSLVAPVGLYLRVTRLSQVG